MDGGLSSGKQQQQSGIIVASRQGALPESRAEHPGATRPTATSARGVCPPTAATTARHFQGGLVGESPLENGHHQGSGNDRWITERLELRGEIPMLSRNSPHSRPPSSASSSSSSLPRVHVGGLTSYGAGGHDHTRPLPPPRLPEAGITTISSASLAPLTAPLAPLSPSFRSNVPRSGTTTATPILSSNNNININNNNNNNGTSNTQSGIETTNSHVSRSNLTEVTLTVPRPELERAVNEYVETPFRQTNAPASVPSNLKCLKNERRHHHHHHHHHHQQQQQHHHHNQQQQQQQHHNNQQSISSPGQRSESSQPKSGAPGSATTTTTSPAVAAAAATAQARNQENNNGSRRHRSNLLQSSLSSGVAITKQPVSFTKEPSSVLGSGSLGPGGNVVGGLGTGVIGIPGPGTRNDPSLSIMCDFCGRCRCESCREPPPLPSRWLCDNSCFCSAETALDYASCLCCVKGLFYHCADSGSGTDSEAGGNCADEPCSCTGPRRTARWACLGALSLLLPCLLCYWPLKGCVAACEACYARHAAQGCRCDPNNPHNRHHTNPSAQSVVSRDSRDPEKRLLDPVTPEL